jgi:uncharacterized oligopeptide transporter (OPT) family protein
VCVCVRERERERHREREQEYVCVYVCGVCVWYGVCVHGVCVRGVVCMAYVCSVCAWCVCVRGVCVWHMCAVCVSLCVMLRHLVGSSLLPHLSWSMGHLVHPCRHVDHVWGSQLFRSNPSSRVLSPCSEASCPTKQLKGESPFRVSSGAWA